LLNAPPLHDMKDRGHPPQPILRPVNISCNRR
jgi:hypothetical protein